jgi:preprotein translocase subunit SecA
VEKAQKQMEARHYSIRKHLFDYDSVIDKQRQRIYKKRDEILENKIDIISEIKNFIPEIIDKLVETYFNIYPPKIEELVEQLAEITGENISTDEIKKFKNPEDIKDYLIQKLTKQLEQKFEKLNENPEIAEKLMNIIKTIYLNVLDRHWIKHIDDMTYLRDKVSLY